MAYKSLIEKLYKEKNLSDPEYKSLILGMISDIENYSPNQLFNIRDLNGDDDIAYLFYLARQNKEKYYGDSVFLRGLIEFTNYCKNDCFYCGIRAGNSKCQRYRLSENEILACADRGYELGFRTFVLQGGEDMYFTDSRLCSIISQIKASHPDCAITLSVGEKEKESYLEYYKAGAERYLLRHETADDLHYSKLHPGNLSLDNRKKCLYDLKDIGYQVGCGFMVGSPYQSIENMISDIRFMQDLAPHMIGIGPFIPHKDTPFNDFAAGGLKATLVMLAILRLTFPEVLLPATTALGTIHPMGREIGILAGANVVMPNLSPGDVREKYLLYDGKICTGEEAAECHKCMENRIKSVGYQVVSNRGDYVNFQQRVHI